MRARQTKLLPWAVIFLILVTVVPAGYILLLQYGMPHQKITYRIGWEDSNFTLTNWNLSSNAKVGILPLTSQNGVLGLHSEGNVTSGTILSAERQTELNFSVYDYNQMRFSVMTSSVNVAARIVIWKTLLVGNIVLLKTYNDRLWHTEFVDLASYGITGNGLFEVELSFQAIGPISGRTIDVSFIDLAFLQIRVG